MAAPTRRGTGCLCPADSRPAALPITWRAQYGSTDTRRARAESPGAVEARLVLARSTNVASGALKGESRARITNTPALARSVPPLNDTQANGINPRGDIVGIYGRAEVVHSYLLREGQFTLIDVTHREGVPGDRI
jgi:hypothetical protein